MKRAPKHGATTTDRTMPMGAPPKGPNGERLCRWCHDPVGRGRRTFCSDDCMHEWRIRRDPGYVRSQVYRRDHGVCAICGLDTVAALKTVNDLRRQARDEALWMNYQGRTGACRDAARRRFEELLVMNGLPPDPPPRHRTGTLWDADHIVPVVEGGGTCGLEGYRTLCVWCHKQETAKLATRRARERQPQQELSFGEGAAG